MSFLWCNATSSDWLSSSVLSSKAGLSRPVSSIHTGPLLQALLDPVGGEGVPSLRSVCGDRGDLGGLVTIARSSPLSLRGPSTAVWLHLVPGHLFNTSVCQSVWHATKMRVTISRVSVWRGFRSLMKHTLITNHSVYISHFSLRSF